MEDEKLAVGIVDTIEELVIEKNIKAPALLIFGEVVSLHPSFQPIKDFYRTLQQEQ
jgi:uroporphyrin-III C-methyltransferase